MWNRNWNWSENFHFPKMAEIIVLSSSDDEMDGARDSKSDDQVLSNHSDAGRSDESKMENCFVQFISACQQCIDPTDDKGLKIIQKFEKKYKTASKLLSENQDFVSLVEDSVEKVKNDPSNVFVHVKNVSDELSAWSKISRNSLSNGTKDGTKPHDEVVCESTSGSSKSASDESKTDKHIRRLERLLAAIHRKICKLQEQELSIDDLEEETSTYLLEDRYKKRFMQVWNRLCELKGREPTTGRFIEKFSYKGSRFPEINARITKYVNRQKQFPDFLDVLTLVTEVCKKNKIPLSSTHLHDLAKETFAEVGEILRGNRLKDLSEFFECHTSNSADVSGDPALEDPELARKLDDSQKKAKENIEKVLQDYVDKQYQSNIDDTARTSSDENSEDNEDEYDDEDNSAHTNEEEVANLEEVDDEEHPAVTITEIAEEFKDEVENYCEATDNVEKRYSEDESNSSEEQSDNSSEGATSQDDWNGTENSKSVSNASTKVLQHSLEKITIQKIDIPQSSGCLNISKKRLNTSVYDLPCKVLCQDSSSVKSNSPTFPHMSSSRSNGLSVENNLINIDDDDVIVLD